MNRVKDIQEKAKAPKVDKGAAKRFVKNSLWQAAKAKTQEDTPCKTEQTTIQIGNVFCTKLMMKICQLCKQHNPFCSDHINSQKEEHYEMLIM